MNIPPASDKYIHLYNCLKNSSDCCYMIDKIIPNNERIVKNIFNPNLIGDVNNLTIINKTLKYVLFIKRYYPNYVYRGGCNTLDKMFKKNYITNKTDLINHYKKYHKLKLLFYLKCVELYVKYSIKKTSKDEEFYKNLKSFCLKKYGSLEINYKQMKMDFVFRYLI